MTYQWRGIFAAVLASVVIVLAPLPLGSDGQFWWALWLVPLLAVIAAAGFPLKEACRDLGLVFVAFAAIAAVLGLQGAIGSGLVVPSAWQLDIGTNTAGLRPSHNGFGTTRFVNALWCLSAVAAACLAGYVLGTERGAALTVIHVYALAGAGYACIAIALFMTLPENVFWHVKTAHRDVLTTPFLNRNVACAFYGYAAISAILLAMRAALPAPHADTGTRAGPGIKTRSTPRISSTVFWVVCAMVCASAALLTGSRAGIATILIGTGAAALIYRPRQLPRLLMSKGALLLLAGTGLVLFLAFGGAISNRLASRGVGDIDRWTTYASAVAMVTNHPWLGVGALNFADAFPPYRLPGASPVGSWERAHSLPLQVAVEFGLPAAVLLVGAWLAVGLRLWRLGRRARDNPAIALAGGAWLAAGLHSLVDYPMQIAGLALPLLLITGCAIRRVAVGERQSGHVPQAS